MANVSGGHLKGFGSWTKLRIVFGADLRTLALFRVLLGFYLLLNVLLRARDLTAHYTDFGIVPRNVQIGLLADGSWSLHLFNGTFAAQLIVFLFAAFAALGLMLGWRTRLMTIVSWILLLSVQNRNTFILSGEDNLALLLTFWAMFLPLGARYSVDCALDRSGQERQHAYWSWATTALLLQGMSMYFFSALLKSDPIWIPDGTAVYYALNLDYMVTALAVWFRQFEALLKGLTYYVWALELIGPFLIFSPIFHRSIRAVIMVLFITMHLGFWLFLEIGLFPFISIVMNLTFMPGWMWDMLGRLLERRGGKELTIWYDHDCQFCLKMCHLLRVFLVLPRAELRPAQQDPKINEILTANNSWVVTAAGEQKQKWSAFALLLAESPVLWPITIVARWVWVEGVGNKIYDLVARYRSHLSTVTAYLLPWKSQTHHQTRVSSILVIGLFAFVTVQNLSTLPKLGLQLPNNFVQIRQALGLYQNWTMFAPYPEPDSPRPLISGTLEDGTIVDPYNNTMVAPDLEPYVPTSQHYHNYRWRKFLSNLEDQSYEQGDQILALNYSRYLCRLWNQNHGDKKKLSTVTIKFIVHKTMPPGQQPQRRDNDVWYHDCFDTG